MKYISVLSFLLLSFSNFICGMEPESPKSSAGLESPVVTCVHRKCLSDCKDPVHKTQNYTRKEFEHDLNVVCVIVKARLVQGLTEAERAAAAQAREIERNTPKGPCLKY